MREERSVRRKSEYCHSAVCPDGEWVEHINTTSKWARVIAALHMDSARIQAPFSVGSMP